MILAVTFGLLISSMNLFAELKVDKNVSYGPHQRNVLDVYWNTDYKNAPIVFTIHGGGFKQGDKSYCNKDMQKLYVAKGCIVVSPNYRLVKKGTPVTKDDCALDAAMAVAYVQANAKKYGGDPTKIVATGASAGGYISAWIAYQKKWEWPVDAKHKPKKLNIVGWFGNSPFLPPARFRHVRGQEGTPRHPRQTGSRHPGCTQEEQGLEQDGLRRLHGTRSRQAHPLQPAITGQGNPCGLQPISRHGLPRQGQAQG